MGVNSADMCLKTMGKGKQQRHPLTHLPPASAPVIATSYFHAHPKIPCITAMLDLHMGEHLNTNQNGWSWDIPILVINRKPVLKKKNVLWELNVFNLLARKSLAAFPEAFMSLTF